MKYLILDYETRSKVDLKKAGAFEYSRDPSTEILCAAWCIVENGVAGPVETWSPFLNGNRWTLPDFDRVVAHNAFFEWCITSAKASRHLTCGLFPYVFSERDKWICTAALAASYALPRSLENACLALDLPFKKDTEGRRLILKYCKPRKPTKANRDLWHRKTSELKRIIEYCASDIRAETALFLRLKELNPIEKKVWCLDQAINERGFSVDRHAVKRALSMIEIEASKLEREIWHLTRGEVRSTKQRDATLKVLSSMGLEMPDLQAGTVEKFLPKATGPAKRLLEIRQSLSKSSTAKYNAFEIRSRYDGRCRDNLFYHAASTGRWGGSGVQPQNFPRGTIKNLDVACQVLKTCDLEHIRLLYGDPMQFFSSCLRGMIVTPKGKTLFCADYNAIETRVLFWLANHEEGLTAFREGVDLYKEMAREIFRLEDVWLVTSAQRQLGKQAILGCGYGMGFKKFQKTCEMQKQKVTPELARVAVDAYRELHFPVVELWGKYERIAILATKSKKKLRVNHTTWWVEDGFLFCELPSGRRLAYYKPQVTHVKTPYGQVRETLFHYGVDSLTKKWVLSSTYGGKLVENVVQGVARDFMASAMLKLEDAGYDLVLTVHDEILAERENGQGSIDDFCKIMSTNPDWGLGCPLKVEGWSGNRYHK